MGKKKSGNFNQLFSSENDGSGGGRDSTTSTDDSHDHGKNQAILLLLQKNVAWRTCMAGGS